MADPQRVKRAIQSVRKQVLVEHLSAMGHYQQFALTLSKMQKLADESYVTEDDKDKFAMLSNIADKHWKVVDKYIPSAPTGAAHNAQSTVSALQRAVLRLAMPDAAQPIAQPTQAHNDTQSPGNTQPEMVVNTNTSMNEQDIQTSAD